MQDCLVRDVDFSTVLNFQHYNDQVKAWVSIRGAGLGVGDARRPSATEEWNDLTENPDFDGSIVGSASPMRN